MAKAIVAKSPISYAIIAEKLDSMQAWNTSQITPAVQPLETIEHPDRSERSAQETGELPQKSFVMHAFLSGDYYHRTAIRLSPKYGPWPEKRNSNATFVNYALEEAIPAVLGLKGLRDWSTGGQDIEDWSTVRARHEREISLRDHIASRHKRRADKTPRTVADIMNAPATIEQDQSPKVHDHNQVRLRLRKRR